ncbi:unnamed protein product [Linum trigynum]|uniref:Clp ATPase C-terminal domain-containing protein n=1 Tax=Linum trigynum TaxID=586398 RepID=A0AAV2EDW9_9ROSI
MIGARNLSYGSRLYKAIPEKLRTPTTATYRQKPHTEMSIMRVDNLEQRLKGRVVGQDAAVSHVSQAIRRSQTGARNTTRPLASFLFHGPSGVGKKKLAEAIAIEFYGSKRSLVRIDMGEHMEKHFLYPVTESDTDRAVILFCEIDKASPAIARSLLQIIDDGEFPKHHVGLKCSFRNVPPHNFDFRDTIIIMTSNVAQPRLNRHDSQVRQGISKNLSEIFRAQLLYRIDEIVLFKMLTKEDLMMMVDAMVKELVDKMKYSKSIKLEVTEELKNSVISVGYNCGCGAKQLKWAFARLVEDQLADGILKGTVKNRCSVTVDYDPFYESLFTSPASTSDF